MIKLEEGEQNIKIVRRHYLVMVPIVLTLIFGARAPSILYYFLISGFVSLNQNLKTIIENFVSNWSVFGYAIWILILWVVFFIEWTDYYLDLWIVTDRRIIDIEQKGFFYREVTSFSFRQIQDITVETRGFIETFFKFGTLHIQTAGHSREIVIRDAYYPEEARSLILRLQEKLISI